MKQKILIGISCILLLTLCTLPSGNNPTNAQTGDSTLNSPGKAGTDSLPKWGVWGGGKLTSAELKQYPYLKGWYIVYQWKDLEPSKDNFDWNYFDQQMRFAADNGLDIGFMIWVGPHSPEWLYSIGVPKVSTQTKKKHADFPFYFDETYKKRYYGMLKAVGDHIQQMPPYIKNRIVLWMSAEGSTGDITPYKGYPYDDKYTITDETWFNYKKEVWTYMYKMCQSANPKINLLVNQANDGRYFNWLTTNLPNVWMKAGNISHTYQFNGELEYYKRLQQLTDKTIKDPASSRLRGEITVQGTWFNQNESWNMYALLTSALHFGLDIFNAAPKYLTNPVDSISFNFFNFYAGQKNPATAPGAFCVLRDGLDAADTKRFPESKYGPVIDPAESEDYNKQMMRKGYSEEEDDNDEGGGADDQTINQSNIKNDFLAKQRIDKILAEYAPYGAKRGDINELEDEATETVTAPDNTGVDEAKLTKRQQKQAAKNPEKAEKIAKRQAKKGGSGKATGYQKKREASMVINDIGVNILPDNYYKFLTQYSPNTTSRGYWRVGPDAEPYGRFARGFEAKEGKKEMWFTLDKHFFSGSTAPQKVAVRIIYLDKGNGVFSLNYHNGNGKTEAQRFTCGNTGRWLTKTVYLDNAVFAQKLEHGTDVSLQYISGDNTVFNSIEILRR